jgi:protein TonB
VGDNPVTGVTRIRYSVDAQGRVTLTEVLQPSGPSRTHRALDRLAERTLRQCRDVVPGVDEEGRPTGGILDVEWKIR